MSIIETIREELGRQRKSREWLATEARISPSTLEKALTGRRPFPPGAVYRIGEALGLDLADGPSPSAVAPDELGAYSRKASEWLAGDYLALRPALKTHTAIFAFALTLEWLDAKSCMVARMREYFDGVATQTGLVSIAPRSASIQLVWEDCGERETTMLQRPDAGGAMAGIHLTAGSQAGHSGPLAFPLALIARDKADVLFGKPVFGLSGPGSSLHGAYARKLGDSVLAGNVRILQVATS